MSDLLKRLENLSPEKRELVLQKLKKQQQLFGQDNDRKTPLLTPTSRQQSLPLSFAQARLWFLDQLEGENCAYNVPFFWQLSGFLNIAALEQALREVVQRHEVLRTSFAVVDGEPIQVIHAHPQLTMQVLDWRQLTEENQLSKAQQLATEELQQPFDLSNPPLLRVKLLQLTDQSHLLLLVIHHIVCDGWSMQIFRRELFSIYSALCAKETSPLPELSLQYADFAHWQRQWLQGEVLETQLNYWQKQLAAVPPLLELPTDRPRPSVQSFRGRSEFLELNQDLTQKLKRLSQESGTTLFMTLLTVFTLLLSRYSGQEDIVVGSAIANRNRRETESLIGFFVNTLALRTNLQGNPTFLELLQRVKQATLDAYDHQDLPFEKLVDELGLERSLSHHPLFQVAFSLQNETQQQLETNGLTLTPFKWENTTTLLDLSLIFRETPQGLIGEWEYATDLFAAKTIQRMTGHFAVLLQRIVDNPQQPIDTLPLITEAERQQLQNWNQTQTDYPDDKTLVDLFEAQVAKTPDNLALVFESQSLTYQQLNHKANQLAHYLIQNHQIQPDTLIGICVERSLEMIIGVLGILKAGGAYLPIDPSYPEDRIQWMLQDSGTSVLLTQSFLTEKLALTQLENPCQIICLDQTDFSETLIDNLSPKSTPDNLAYVIYTSGSTGRPKGVMIEHRGLTNLASSVANTLQVQPQSRFLQFASFSFDISVAEIAPTLATGACLYLAKKDTLLPGQGLVDFLGDRKISHIIVPPSALSVLPQATLPDLQTIGVGGEACPAELVAQWATGRRLFNGYGPTESTVSASIAICQPNGKKPPIGKPLSNVRIYILDTHNQPLPPGIPGELCIAGVGLARGYLNRPDLTAKKFIEVELFGKIERIYKTGDLARWEDNGNLEYLGRIDDQIKLRGFRIELGEIESLLLQHPSVKEAVVILYETDHNPRLVGYITAAEKSSNLGSQLKDYLKIRLPNYMVPSQIMVLDQLPLTPNGKLDRRALPAPDTVTSTNFEIPVTPTEKLLATLWQSLLKAKSVSRQDNFFELGGHSLLATQLVTRIRDSFGVELPVRKVFEQSILSELAIEIDKASSVIALPPITPQPENAPKTLSFAQSRLWFLAQLEGTGTSATYNMSTALQLEGKLNIEALRASFDYLLDRHPILRTYFPALEGQPQVVAQNLEDIEVLAIADLQSLNPQTQAETVQRLSDTHAQEPFDLNTGPLFKAKLLQLGEQKNVLLLNMHHIISDGWSMGVFKREWEQAYSAFAAGDAPNLPPLPIQYSDYAAWQRSWLQGEILENQKNYWKQQLGDAPRLLDLPTDHPRPAQQSYEGGREEYCLSGELTEKLKIVSQKHGVSLFMTLLTAFNILLLRYSRQEDLCVGSAIANRTHSHTEGLIGFFVNTLVLRSKIKPEQAFSQLLQETRQTCLDAYAHQDIPFEYLVEQLQPERSLSHNPLFQVMIVLQNTEGAGTNVSLPGLDIQWLDQDYPFAKFDLTLDLCERDGQLRCMWEYATDLFEAETIRRMAGHFEALLEAITENPQQMVSKLPLMTTAEIQQLQLWNKTNTDYPKNQTLVTLFEQQAAQTPDNIAVVFEDQSLSYQELNQKANQLAYSLLELKAEQQLPDNPLIAICVERSPEMVVGLFGILKAGGAYVPIDPNYPQERIHFMLEDCGARVLLTHSQLKDKLAIANKETLPHPLVETRLTASLPKVLCLDKDNFANQSTDNPSCQSQPNDLAYVIYTSGSTGQPKGVQLLHRGLTNYLHWAKDFYAVAQGQGTPVQSSLSFDATITSLYLPLICGRTTTLVREKQEIEALANIVKQNKHLSLVKITPSHLEILNQQLNADAMPNRVNAFVLGGEALHTNQIRPWLTYAPNTRLINEYGPTEAVVGCCVYEATGKIDLIGDLLIGQPIANARIYILDNQNQPLPPGIPGELCIAGAGLARGYLNRPELTAEKFIELDLFGERERVYKTGDLARWLPDGNLEYLGRIDNQVKLRGFRIELGEIEALLAKHPKIQQAVVILQREDAIAQRLLAYIVPTPTDKDFEDKSLQVEQVELWQQVFSDSYSQQQTPIDDPTLNLAGWNDSYTGKPIPQAAMREWRDTTVAQILELEPKRIWEIGCGTGMLLFKIAPHCQHYLGTDFSLEALQYIEQHLKQQSLNDKVTLKTSAANQFDAIETNAYDLVIINSVIQYFPSLDYFLQVLEGVVKAVTTQGSIFIGDVRNLQLLEAFHTAVEFYGAPDDLSIRDLRQQIKKSIDTEGELLIDPDFFIALKQRIPRITQVQIQLQRGYAQTEMSRFRYDVVLHLDQTDTPVAEPQCLDWQGEKLNLETIGRILTTQQPDLLRINNIPNARLTSEMALLEEIAQLDSTVSDLKAAIAQAKPGIEPEVFRIAGDLPYTLFIQYSSTGFANYDVVFQRNIPGQVTLPRFTQGENLRLKPWQDYANQPLQYRTNQVDPTIFAEWREFLGKTLPDYMIPSHFTVLEKLPLTPNGKVDRKALPAPNATVLSTDIELPVTSTEKLLAQLWAKLLKYAAIARHDNFFDLGGHSLLATQLCYRIRDIFKVELPLRRVFEYPTLTELANYLDTCIWINASTADMQPLNSDEEEIEL
ncbi:MULTISPECIES: non-ribosomal peptide synthetase [Nostoc]|uniref:Amino acid adenylation domain-containing protein n=2 Tax=Nostoc TaxID=1177 RepID=A0ABR8I4I1_9NOSO|nr:MULTISPECIES: non-ribosomal peptide synthetase [Nostoc]MBD2561225.1 amino acid adenylation domain-containing protein [Nostoc linckia FACHB-391]MBD2645988.1 amino acid adenylation domain-containing protein [Nostoc foliaceum FACHB-393]